MPSLVLTDMVVKNLKPQEMQVDYFDQVPVIQGDGGRLVLRISPAGRKSWCIVYRLNGKQRRYTFSKVYPELSLKNARKEAAKRLVSIMDGNDPALEVRKRRQAPTFKELCDDYIERHAKIKKAPKSCYEDDLMIKTDLKAWHDRKAGDIKRRDVIRLLDEIADRAPVKANRVKALVSKIYNVGIRRDLVEFNPATNIAMPTKERARDRAYSDDEIKALWAAFKHVRAGLRGVLELILLTAQRPGEVAGMMWSEINGDAWSLPAERTKNRRAHVVPLVGQAREIIDGLTGNDIFIFPADRNETHTRVNFADLQVVRNKSGVADFTAHDLRRTALTNMGKMGVNRFIQDRIANHADQSMGGVYDRHEYFKEKAAALSRWSNRLAQILDGKSGKVIELGRAAQ